MPHRPIQISPDEFEYERGCWDPKDGTMLAQSEARGTFDGDSPVQKETYSVQQLVLPVTSLWQYVESLFD
jgi:hypothetical protein